MIEATKRLAALGGFCILLGLGACATPLPPKTADGKCVMGRVVSIPVEVTGDRIYMRASINGLPARLMFDTGSGGISIREAAAQRLHLSLTDTEATAEGVAGESALYLTEPVSLNFAGHDLPKGRLIVLEDTDGARDLDGFMGVAWARDFDLEFDLAVRSLTFWDPDHCQGVEAALLPQPVLSADLYWNADRRLTVPVAFNRHAEYAILDTGANQVGMDWTTAARFGITRKTPGLHNLGTTGGFGTHLVEHWAYLLPYIQIGDETMRNFPIEIWDRAPGRTSNLFLLGYRFFEKNHVYLSAVEHKMYFSPYRYSVADEKSAPAAK